MKLLIQLAIIITGVCFMYSCWHDMHERISRAEEAVAKRPPPDPNAPPSELEIDLIFKKFERMEIRKAYGPRSQITRSQTARRMNHPEGWIFTRRSVGVGELGEHYEIASGLLCRTNPPPDGARWTWYDEPKALRLITETLKKSVKWGE